MAPPQVDLTKKQPLEDVQGWAEKVGDQKLPPLPPLTPSAPVPVETSTTVAGKRSCLARRRCKKLIIGIIIGAVVATAIVVGAFMAHRRYHHKHESRNRVKDREGHHAEEHVRMEGSKRLIHIARNATNHFFGLLAVLDYETRLAGFKDCNKNRCYIDRLRESYEEGCRRYWHYQHHGRLLTERAVYLGPAVPTKVLRYFAGEEIFSVCGELPSFWVLEVEPQTPHGHRERDDSDSHDSDSDSRDHDNDSRDHDNDDHDDDEIPSVQGDNSTEIIYL